MMTPTAATSKAALVEAMLGRALAVGAGVARREIFQPEAGAVALECHGLSKAGLFQDSELAQSDIILPSGRG